MLMPLICLVFNEALPKARIPLLEFSLRPQQLLVQHTLGRIFFFMGMHLMYNTFHSTNEHHKNEVRFDSHVNIETIFFLSFFLFWHIIEKFNS